MFVPCPCTNPSRFSSKCAGSLRITRTACAVLRVPVRHAPRCRKAENPTGPELRCGLAPRRVSRSASIAPIQVSGPWPCLGRARPPALPWAGVIPLPPSRASRRAPGPGSGTARTRAKSADHYGALEHAHAALKRQGTGFVGGDYHVYGLFERQGLLDSGFRKHDLVGAGSVGSAGEA